MPTKTSKRKKKGGWGAVHGELWCHPKVMELIAMGEEKSAPALALWLRAFSFLQANAGLYGDGVIPDSILPLFGYKGAEVYLVEVGLWEHVFDGWRFHDWFVWQQGAAEIRQKRSEAGKASGRARKKALKNRALTEGNMCSTSVEQVLNKRGTLQTTDYRQRESKTGPLAPSFLKPAEDSGSAEQTTKAPTLEQNAPDRRPGRLAPGVARALASEARTEDSEQDDDRVPADDFRRWKTIAHDALSGVGFSVAARRGSRAPSPWEHAAAAALSHSQFHGCPLAVSVSLQVASAIAHKDWSQKPAFVISDTVIPKPPTQHDDLAPLGPPEETT